MNYRTRIINDIEQWLSEEIITKEQADTLIARYSDNKVINPSQIILGILGGLFVFAGITITIVSMWQHIPLQLKQCSAFFPLFLALTISIYYFSRKNKTVSLGESVSLIYCICCISTLKLTESLYATPTDPIHLIFCITMMILPVMLIFRTVSSSLFMLFSVTLLGILLTQQYEESLLSYIIFVVLCAVILLILLLLYKSGCSEKILFKIIFVWVAAVSALTLMLIFANICNADMGLILFIGFSMLTVIGNTSKQQLAHLSSVGSAGITVLLIMYCLGTIETFTKNPGIINSAYPAVLIILLMILFMFSDKKDFRKIISITASIVLVPLSLINAFSDEKELPFFSVAILSMLLLASGIIYLADGIRNIKISNINTGIVSVSAVLYIIFENSINSVAKGIIIIIAGLIITSADIFIISRNRKNKKLTEVQDNEK